MFDVGQAVLSGVATVEHKADRSQIGLARSRFDFQAANGKTFRVRTRRQSGKLRPTSLLLCLTSPHSLERLLFLMAI